MSQANLLKLAAADPTNLAAKRLMTKVKRAQTAADKNDSKVYGDMFTKLGSAGAFYDAAEQDDIRQQAAQQKLVQADSLKKARQDQFVQDKLKQDQVKTLMKRNGMAVDVDTNLAELSGDAHHSRWLEEMDEQAQLEGLTPDQIIAKYRAFQMQEQHMIKSHMTVTEQEQMASLVESGASQAELHKTFREIRTRVLARMDEK